MARASAGPAGRGDEARCAGAGRGRGQRAQDRGDEKPADFLALCGEHLSLLSAPRGWELSGLPKIFLFGRVRKRLPPLSTTFTFRVLIVTVHSTFL